MPGIRVKDEPFESAMKRFKRGVDKAGIMPEKRRRKYHEKDSAKRVRLRAAAIKRSRKRLMRDARFADSVRGGRRSIRRDSDSRSH